MVGVGGGGQTWGGSPLTLVVDNRGWSSYFYHCAQWCNESLSESIVILLSDCILKPFHGLTPISLVKARYLCGPR